MKNSLDMENEYFNEDYSSLCSSCNSILQSICSIGIPSIYESNFENDSVKTQVGKDVTSAKNIDTIQEDIRPRIYGTQKINEKNNDKISCSKTKEIKNIESLNKVSSKPKIISIKRLNSKNYFKRMNRNSKRILCVNKNSDENYATLSNATSKSSMLMKPTLDNMLHYEPLMVNTSQTAKENTIIQSMTSNDSSSTNLSLIKVHNKSDYIKRDVLNQRKKVLKTIDSILHLCNYINIMREVILETVHKNTVCLKMKDVIEDNSQTLKNSV